MSTCWNCIQCTFNNPLNVLSCEICGKRRPRNSASNRKRLLSSSSIDIEPPSKRAKLENDKNKTKKKHKKKLKKKIKKKKKPIIRMIYEAIINNSVGERSIRNGLTKSKIINYVKQNMTINNNDTILIISSIEDGLKRGVLQKSDVCGRYKMTHLGLKENTRKNYSKQYDINSMTEKQIKKESIQNKIQSKYNEKYYSSKDCKFDDELKLNDSIINAMNIQILKNNLKYRGLKVGGNKRELTQRLKNYLKSEKCINSKTYKELKENLKYVFEYKFKYKCTKNLFNLLIKINNKFMKMEVSNDIWQFIAMYAAGIKTECCECPNEIFVMDPNKINTLIDDEYYILNRCYAKDNQNKFAYSLQGRVICAECISPQHCRDCNCILHPNDAGYNGFEGCYCVVCDKCNDAYPFGEEYSGWCYRAGIPHCNQCIDGLSSHEKEW